MTMTLEWGESGQQHASALLYPRERPGTLFTEGRVGPRAGVDGRKITSPPGFDTGPSSPQSVAIPTELPGPQFILVHTIYTLCEIHLFQKYSEIEQHSVYLSLHIIQYILVFGTSSVF